MAFIDLSSELSSVLPGLSPTLADTFINRSWRKIRDARAWSFLISDAAVVCPAALQAGGATYSQFSTTVTLNAAASAALTPFLLGVPLATQLQIRFMAIAGAPTTSEVYNILAADPTVPTAIVLTLDRIIQEASATAAPYLIYRAYVIPPVPDFLGWISLVDQVNAITIAKSALTLTSAYFDCRDPQRQSLGLAYYLGFYAGNQQVTPTTTAPQSTLAQGQPIYELWPHSTQGQTFYVRYRRRGQPFVNATDAPPPGIPDSLIVNLALLDSGYPHVQVNIGQFPMYKGVNWPVLYERLRTTVYGNLGVAGGHRGSLQDAKLQDEAQASQMIINRGKRGLTGRFDGDAFPGLIDSSYWQSHAIFW